MLGWSRTGLHLREHSWGSLLCESLSPPKLLHRCPGRSVWRNILWITHTVQVIYQCQVFFLSLGFRLGATLISATGSFWIGLGIRTVKLGTWQWVKNRGKKQMEAWQISPRADTCGLFSWFDLDPYPHHPIQPTPNLSKASRFGRSTSRGARGQVRLPAAGGQLGGGPMSPQLGEGRGGEGRGGEGRGREGKGSSIPQEGWAPAEHIMSNRRPETLQHVLFLAFDMVSSRLPNLFFCQGPSNDCSVQSSCTESSAWGFWRLLAS